MLEDSYDRCEGGHCKGENYKSELHTCPYAEEINEDSDTLCDCCETCMHECAMDI